MSRHDLILHAPTQPDNHWHPTEIAGETVSFRWSTEPRLIWQPNAASQDGFNVIIPFLGTVAPDFIAHSLLLINGMPAPHTVGNHQGFACITSSIDERYVQDVVLVTPEPVRSGNEGDQRAMGIAVLTAFPIVTQTIRELPKPAIAEGVAPKIALIGNCQAQTYNVLAEAMLGAPLHALVDLSDPRTRQPEYKQHVIEQFQTADIILAQHNQYLNPAEMEAVSSDKLYRIGGFYFRGLHPDVCYVGDIDHRLDVPSPYHSLVILDAFRRGLSQQECEQSFTIDNFRRLGLLEAWKSSEQELIHRDASLDFPQAKLVIDAVRNYCPFHSINHPTMLLCHEYLSSIFESLNVPHAAFRFSAVADPLMVHNTCLIHDEWAEYLQLPYRASGRQRFVSLNGKFADRPEMIGYYYQEYSKIDPSHLVVNSPGDMVMALRANLELKHLAEKA